MDFELSADQVALRDAAHALLAHHASPARVRAVVDAGGGWDRELWAAMVDQGWPGLAVAEDLGGVGLGAVESAVVLEQVGVHLAPAPILSQLVALAAVVRSGDPATKPLVERLRTGTAIATIAATPVLAQPQAGGGWRLAGTTEPTLFAPSAAIAIVIADPASSGGSRLLAVELTGPGSGARPAAREPAMDLTREVGRLRFDAGDTGVGYEVRDLGGRDAVDAFVDTAAVALSAELLGASARALDLTVAYAKQREQFGRPIGSFQAVKHRCADMLVDVEAMRSVVYHAAWCLAAPSVTPADRSVAASTAKTWCADASKRVMASALQVHGGIGFTWDCDVHLFLKRAQLDQVSFGDAAFHRARLAGLLWAKVEAGEPVF